MSNWRYRTVPVCWYTQSVGADTAVFGLWRGALCTVVIGEILHPNGWLSMLGLVPLQSLMGKRRLYTARHGPGRAFRAVLHQRALHPTLPTFLLHLPGSYAALTILAYWRLGELDPFLCKWSARCVAWRSCDTGDGLNCLESGPCESPAVPQQSMDKMIPNLPAHLHLTPSVNCVQRRWQARNDPCVPPAHAAPRSPAQPCYGSPPKCLRYAYNLIDSAT